MVDDQVHDNTYTAAVSSLQQFLEIGHASVKRVYGPIIGHIIARVHHRRGVDRSQPDSVNAQVIQVIQLCSYAAQIPRTVPIGIVIAARLDLAHDAMLPPYITTFAVHTRTP